jgi:CheY-like chemotaxis protein
VIQELPAGAQVELAANVSEEQVVIALSAVPAGERAWGDAKALSSSTAVAGQLARLFGGELRLMGAPGILALRVRLPSAARRVLVLAIEDNADTLRLWQRYVQDTCFALIAEPDAAQAVESAIRLRPDLIVLDIMLPGIDGWALLRQLRSKAPVRAIPVIVCTVLPQRELALSLGASDFMQKPVTGGQFRAALERQRPAAAPPR